MRHERSWHFARILIGVVAVCCAASAGRSQDGATPHSAGERFRDCGICPEMVVVPAGDFTMGSPPDEVGRNENESPQRTVRIAAFAAGRFEVTFDEWKACVSSGGCNGYQPGDYGYGEGTRPVIHVSMRDARLYAQWLSTETGESYRLLTEAEWEYAARAGTNGAYWWGAAASHEYANYGAPVCCDGLAAGRDEWARTSPVGSFPANAFGLHDMNGNVWEWVEDCYDYNYADAPTDGSAVTSRSDCAVGIGRGGSWDVDATTIRAAMRQPNYPRRRHDDWGFRVARTVSDR